jgi:hypothetical protein
VVVRADEDQPPPDRRGAVDVAASALRPEQPPTRRAVGVDLAVGAADEDAAVRGRGRRIERPAPAEPRLCRGPPGELPRSRVDRVDAAVVRADVDTAAGMGQRAFDPAVRSECPAGTPCAGVERPDPAVPVADVHTTVHDERRRLVEPCGASPCDLAGPCLVGDQDSVPPRHRLTTGRTATEERHEDELLPDGRRGPSAPVRRAAPDRLSRAGVERVETAVEGRQVQASMGERGWELEQRPAAEGPGAPKRRPEVEARRVADSPRVVAVCGPRRRRELRRLRIGRLRLRWWRCRSRNVGGDELVGRRAADVLAGFPHRQHVSGRRDEEERRRAGARDRPGPPAPPAWIHGPVVPDGRDGDPARVAAGSFP